MIIVMMGVAGSGKTTIGKLLASNLSWQFADADDFHSAANVEKMRSGMPLTDDDRWPWLERLRSLLSSWIQSSTHGVLACSALKQTYRDRLKVSDEVRFVYLKEEEALLRERLQVRPGHYMKSGMLDTQLATLEEPHDALTVDASRTPAEIVEEIKAGLTLSSQGEN